MKLEIDISKDINTYDDLLVSLGGRRRIEILKLISDEKEWTVTDLSKKLNCKIANVSQQVRILENSGLITKRLAKTIGNTSKIIKSVYDEILIKL
jgi:predicted transcriptional regulator